MQAFVRRKRKRVDLGDFVFSNERERVFEVRIGFSWKSDDQIGSDIDSHAVFALKRPKRRKFFEQDFAGIFPPHLLQYRIGP